MEEIFKTIAPYSQSQIKETLVWLENSEVFIKGVQYFYPNWNKDEVIKKLKACHTCSDFQVTFIEMIIKNSIRNTMDSFEIVGLEGVDTTNSLFISNHRDIFMDSALLQNYLYDTGRPFTEISLGDNLMVNDTMKAVAKLNNMFTVFRGGKRMEQLKNSVNLSKYIRHSIIDKKVSSWIAQGNGRTKDGNDITATGLIKMLLLSGGAEIKNSLAELNIVISTISFEYEPCAFEKAHELSLLDEEGTYHKKEFENISSILKGIHDHKGQVKLVFEKLNVDNIEFTNNRKKDV
ncbi:MAG: acyltransferase, partial [Bacteroidetes bacterium]